MITESGSFIEMCSCPDLFGSDGTEKVLSGNTLSSLGYSHLGATSGALKQPHGKLMVLECLELTLYY